MVGRGTWRGGRLPVLDALLAAGLVLAAVLQVAASPAPHPWGEVVAGLWTSSLAFRTVSPTLTAVVASLGAAGYATLPGAPETPLWAFVTALAVAFTIGARIGGRRGIALAGLLLASGLALQLTSASHDGTWAQQVGTVVVIFGGPWAAGRLLRRERLRAGRLRQLGAELEAQRRAHVLAAAAQERNRIAGELHDVISHAVGAMVVQAGAAEQQLPADAPALGALRAVRETGREALAELRHQLGVLRSDESGPPVLPAIADVVRLAGDTGANLEYDATQVGEVPAGTALAAYRVVQEALTNARKHAAGAPVRVRVGRETADLALDIVNGPGVALPDTSGAGLGLRGMRERVALYSGHFEAGGTAEGGWRVHARLPLHTGEHVLVTS